MLCMNCGKEVAKGATNCASCQTKFVSPPPLDRDTFSRMLAQAGLSERNEADLRELSQGAEFDEELANLIFLGDCPKCGSQHVEDCERIRDREDLTLGHCLDCDVFWCSECGYQLKPDEKSCPHWTVCNRCPDEADCPHLLDATECAKVAKWMKAAGVPRPK